LAASSAEQRSAAFDEGIHDVRLLALPEKEGPIGEALQAGKFRDSLETLLWEVGEERDLPQERNAWMHRKLAIDLIEIKRIRLKPPTLNKDDHVMLKAALI
jgi:hypothetical protein